MLNCSQGFWHAIVYLHCDVNRARFIGDTLDSIIAQMTSDTELIVVDGASTDDTESVVTKGVCWLPIVTMYGSKRRAVSTAITIAP
ncbi:MAG: glycosyltransferase [Pirellulales bacterium]